MTSTQREDLILKHMPQVKLIARRIHRRLPESVSLDDLVSAGVLGLITAIDRYEPSLQLKLNTYAEYRIRGAILDSLRGLDWASRRSRLRAKRVEQLIEKLRQTCQRAPTEEEIAAALGIPLSEYRSWLAEMQGLTVASLESAAQDEGGSLLRYLADAPEHSPACELERKTLEELIAHSIATLPKLEANILQLHFYDHLSLRDIGRKLGLGESRVSQLKSQAVVRLRHSVLAR